MNKDYAVVSGADILSVLSPCSTRSGLTHPFGRMPHKVVRVMIASLIVALIAFFSVRLLPHPVTIVQTAPAVSRKIVIEGSKLAVRGFIVPRHRIIVNSKVTGRVAWIGVEKGDRVQQGQILVRLEDEEFRAEVQQAEGALANARAYLRQLEAGPLPQEVERAEHGVEQARASMMNDEVTLDRTTKLVSEGVLPRETLDNVRAKFEASNEQVQYLEQSLDLIRKGPRREEIDRAKGTVLQAEGQLSLAQSELEATVIRAPISGTILERTAEKGELVAAQFASGSEDGPQGSVVVIANLNDLRVNVDVPQASLRRLALRQKVNITVDAFPDRVFDGRVVEIAPEANSQQVTVGVRVQIVRPDQRLRPQLNAMVTFAEATEKEHTASEAVVVPDAALFDRNGSKWVAIATDGTVHLQRVQVLRRNSEGVFITGVRVGALVVVGDPQNLLEGGRVRAGN